MGKKNKLKNRRRRKQYDPNKDPRHKQSRREREREAKISEIIETCKGLSHGHGDEYIVADIDKTIPDRDWHTGPRQGEVELTEAECAPYRTAGDVDDVMTLDRDAFERHKSAAVLVRPLCHLEGHGVFVTSLPGQVHVFYISPSQRVRFVEQSIARAVRMC